MQPKGNRNSRNSENGTRQSQDEIFFLGTSNVEHRGQRTAEQPEKEHRSKNASHSTSVHPSGTEEASEDIWGEKGKSHGGSQRHKQKQFQRLIEDWATASLGGVFFGRPALEHLGDCSTDQVDRHAEELVGADVEARIVFRLEEIQRVDRRVLGETAYECRR